MPRLLIVDDSRFARRATAKAIRTHFPDWEIVEAQSGEEALDLLRSEDFDFATLDLNMPGITGIEVKEAIDAEKPGLRAALVTANVQDAVRERAEELFVAFLEKPIPPGRLKTLLEEHVGRQG